MDESLVGAVIQNRDSYNAGESHSTVIRARDGDSSAWQRISELYGPLVYNWARLSGLGREDASDLAQTVLMKVFGALSEFNGPSFRAWLKSICRNEIALLFRKRKGMRVHSGGSSNIRLLANTATSPEVDSAEFGPKLESILVQRALGIVRSEYSETSVQAFLSSVTEESSATEIGNEIGLSPAAVRQAKYRILRRMRELLADR